MTFKPVGYEESIIFYVKHYNIRLKIECNFDSGLAIIKFANGNFNNRFNILNDRIKPFEVTITISLTQRETRKRVDSRV